jgi:hypothetical protein
MDEERQGKTKREIDIIIPLVPTEQVNEEWIIDLE